MATKKTVTHEDLLAVEIKIGQEQTKYRHEMKNEIQNCYLRVDELWTDTALLTQSFNSMEKAFAEMKEMLAKHMEREEEQLAKLIDKLDQKFASKWVEKIVAGGIVMILVWFGSYLGLSIIANIKDQNQDHKIVTEKE